MDRCTSVAVLVARPAGIFTIGKHGGMGVLDPLAFWYVYALPPEIFSNLNFDLYRMVYRFYRAGAAV